VARPASCSGRIVPGRCCRATTSHGRPRYKSGCRPSPPGMGASAGVRSHHNMHIQKLLFFFRNPVCFSVDLRSKQVSSVMICTARYCVAKLAFIVKHKERICFQVTTAHGAGEACTIGGQGKVYWFIIMNEVHRYHSRFRVTRQEVWLRFISLLPIFFLCCIDFQSLSVFNGLLSNCF
jgi:hypothetical protein